MTNANTTTQTASVAEQGAHVAPEKATSKRKASKKQSAPKGRKAAKKPAARKEAKPANKKATKDGVPREFSKKAIVLDLLRRKDGATMAQIAEATNWQRHSIRGFVSGMLDEWYRRVLKETVAPLIACWHAVLGVKAPRLFIQRMKTRWGSCNHRACTIRLNTELAKKPRECLEYIVVHELVHLVETTHNARFIALMDRYMPRWQHYRQMLNRLPLRHESWDY